MWYKNQRNQLDSFVNAMHKDLLYMKEKYDMLQKVRATCPSPHPNHRSVTTPRVLYTAVYTIHRRPHHRLQHRLHRRRRHTAVHSPCERIIIKLPNQPTNQPTNLSHPSSGPRLAGAPAQGLKEAAAAAAVRHGGQSGVDGG